MHKNRVRGYNKRFYPGVALIVAAMLCLVFALTRLNVPFLGAMSHILGVELGPERSPSYPSS